MNIFTPPHPRMLIRSALVLGLFGVGVSMGLLSQTMTHPPASRAPAQIFAPLPDTAFNSRPADDITTQSIVSASHNTQTITSGRSLASAIMPPKQDPDLAVLHAIISLYRAGDLAKADAMAKTLTSPISKITAEWAALRLRPQNISFERLTAFLNAHADWPASAVLRKRMEDMLFNDRALTLSHAAYFHQQPAVSTAGQWAYARLLMTQGRSEQAAPIVRALWREHLDVPASIEQMIKEFGALLTRADHKWRADRLFYKQNYAQAAKIAALAGNDEAMLHTARSMMLRDNNASPPHLPASVQNDASLLFAQFKILIGREQWHQAASLISSAQINADTLVDGDEWWVLRRSLARKMLDLGDARAAYQISAGAIALNDSNQLEADFMAGWIALRFLHDARLSQPHFAALFTHANTPTSMARALYWQGRAADVLGDHAAADEFWRQAGQHSGTYYGQLARALRGQNDVPIRKPETIAAPDQRHEAISVVEQLEAIGARDLSLPIISDAARQWRDKAQLSALAAALMGADNAHATLLLGKFAAQRGIELDEAAWPIFGIPHYQPLTHSAPQTIVYAIARQESSFQNTATSSAGAKGLMQMISATAKHTAARAGVAYEEQRLISDPSFNAQLGAAHLAALIDEHSGSLVLAFAAYNAGGRRVKEWIASYGDPRDSSVDPIDWVERIPFGETRNYVQRVTENLGIYRARFGEDHPLRVVEDLRGRPHL